MRWLGLNLYLVVIDSQTDETGELSAFLADAVPRLERALVARFGVDDGLDAVAEATAYGLANWDRLREMANPVGYLYRVGESQGRRLGRRWRRIDALVAEPMTHDAVVDIDLQRALTRLKAPERVAIVLVYGHGYTYRQAADVLDIPTTTITNHINRGMANLRRLLEQR